MFGRRQWKKSDGIGFDVHGNPDEIYPFLDAEINKINERLPDDMMKRIPEIKKKLPHFMAKNMTEVIMFFELKRYDDKVRVFVQGTNEGKIPIHTWGLFSLLMGTARELIKTELKEKNIPYDKVR